MAQRAFRGLRKEEPQPRYDVVVVGAGVGGLVCANLLVREGLDVLLVEQHYMVGGYCSTFKRAGYTFDAGTHTYPLLGNPSTLSGKLLADFGAQTQWKRLDPVDTYHLPDGTCFPVPADFDTYVENLEALFPHQVEPLRQFFAEVREAYLLGVLYHFRERPIARLERLADLSVKDVVDERFQDPRLKLLLTADAPHWGSPPSRTSFVFDSMMRKSYFLGSYYPLGGSQCFVDELAGLFEEAGGHILMSTRTRSITVEEDAVRGVELETLRGPMAGTRRVATRAVVSNADLRMTLEELVGPEHVAASELEALRRLRPTYPCYLGYFGIKGTTQESLRDALGYHWESWDPETFGTSGFRCNFFSTTAYDPSLAPPGKQILIAQKPVEVDYDGIGDWADDRLEMERYFLEELERLLPGITDHVEICLGATAGTSQRFTLNLAGAMLGWEMSPGQLGEGRPSIDGPVEGLYLVGHWVRPGGGVTPVIISALLAAEKITRSDLASRGDAESLD